MLVRGIVEVKLVFLFNQRHKRNGVITIQLNFTSYTQRIIFHKKIISQPLSDELPNNINISSSIVIHFLVFLMFVDVFSDIKWAIQNCYCSAFINERAQRKRDLIGSKMRFSLSFSGPLVCEKDDRWYLVGTTSWGWGCAGQYYGVYTNIAKLFNWIKANMP